MQVAPDMADSYARTHTSPRDGAGESELGSARVWHSPLTHSHSGTVEDDSGERERTVRAALHKARDVGHCRSRRRLAADRRWHTFALPRSLLHRSSMRLLRAARGLSPRGTPARALPLSRLRGQPRPTDWALCRPTPPHRAERGRVRLPRADARRRRHPSVPARVLLGSGSWSSARGRDRRCELRAGC